MANYFGHFEHSDYISKPPASEYNFWRPFKNLRTIIESAGSYISKPPTKFNCSHNSKPPRNQVCLENPLLTAVCRAKVHKHFFGMQLGQQYWYRHSDLKAASLSVLLYNKSILGIAPGEAESIRAQVEILHSLHSPWSPSYVQYTPLDPNKEGWSMAKCRLHRMLLFFWVRDFLSFLDEGKMDQERGMELVLWAGFQKPFKADCTFCNDDILPFIVSIFFLYPAPAEAEIAPRCSILLRYSRGWKQNINITDIFRWY